MQVRVAKLFDEPRWEWDLGRPPISDGLLFRRVAMRAGQQCLIPARVGAWSAYVSMAGSLHFGRGVLLCGGVFIFDGFSRRGLLTSVFEIIIL